MLLEEDPSRLQSAPVTLAANSLHYVFVFFTFFSLFLSFEPSLPNRIPHPHPWCFIYFQSVSFSLLLSYWLQLAEIIGGQLLQ